MENADKQGSNYLIRSSAGIKKKFQEQLARLQMDYIDYYLMHMLNDVKTWEKLAGLGIREWIQEKKAAGQIRSIGFSYQYFRDAAGMSAPSDRMPLHMPM